MHAYLIGHIRVKEPDLWKVYVQGVAESLTPYGAEILFRGTLAKVLVGEHPYHNTVVIKFPDQAALQNWYDSKAYQELIPIRDQAADVAILSYNG